MNSYKLFNIYGSIRALAFLNSSQEGKLFVVYCPFLSSKKPLWLSVESHYYKGWMGEGACTASVQKTAELSHERMIWHCTEHLTIPFPLPDNEPAQKWNSKSQPLYYRGYKFILFLKIRHVQLSLKRTALQIRVSDGFPSYFYLLGNKQWNLEW